MRRDLRGSIHILEVMIVGLLCTGAVVFIATQNVPVDGPFENEKPMRDTQVEDVLENQMALPAQSNAIAHAHRLEELLLQHLMEEDPYRRYVAGDAHISVPTESTLERLLRDNGNAHPYKLELGVDRRNLHVTGYNGTAGEIPATGSVRWLSGLGTSLIRPTLSAHAEGMLVHAEVLPAWMTGVHQPPGQKYEVTAVIEKNGREVEHTSTHHVNLPTDQDRNPFVIAPVKPDGQYGYVMTEGDLGSGEGDNVSWELHFRLEPTHGDRLWLDDTVILRIHRPAGWSQPKIFDDDPGVTPGSEGDWTRLNEDPEDPVWRLTYSGDHRRDDGVAWLNFTVEQDPSVMTRHHHVSVQAERPSWSRATAVLTPDSATQKLPVVVHASHPDPLPLDVESTLSLTVVNPYEQAVYLKKLEVRFPDVNHDLVGDPDAWVPQTDNLEEEEVVVEYEGVELIPTLGAEMFELPVQPQEPDWKGFGLGRAPVVEYLGAGYQLPADLEEVLNLDGYDAMAGVPYGVPGQYLAWFDPGVLQSGEHTLRVPLSGEDEVPPGVGHFTGGVEDANGVLPVLQQARHGMGLSVSPGAHEPGEVLRARVGLGELLPELRGLRDQGLLGEEKVTLQVESASFVEYLAGEVESQVNVSLGLDWGAQIVGLDWVPDAEHPWEPDDLAVGYSDGRVLLLDGVGMPEETLWWERIADSVTAGPFWLEDELAVFGEKNGEAKLYLLDREGAVKETIGVGGVVEEAVVSECLGSGKKLGFVTGQHEVVGGNSQEVLKEGKGEFLLGGSRALGDGGWIRAHFYRGGEVVSGARLPGYEVVGLEEGRFGPLAKCSLVMGGSEVGGEGVLVRYALAGFEEVWRQEVPEGLEGFFVGRVKQAPYEGLLNDHEVNQTVVVTGDGGYRTYGGFAEVAHGVGKSFDLVPGDELIGLSWVDQDVGYVASKMGFVWKTEDGGRGWDKITEFSITSGLPVVEDFAFGGNQYGLFLDEDGLVLEFDGDEFGERWDEVNDMIVVHGLSETKNNPALLGVRPAAIEETGLYEWDFHNHRPDIGDPLLEADCVCEKGGSGNEHGIVVWNQSHVLVTTESGIEWEKDRVASLYNVDSSGTALAFRASDDSVILLMQNETHEERLVLEEDLSDLIFGNLWTSRNPSGPYLVYSSNEQAGVITLRDGKFIHMSAPDASLTNLVGGYGSGAWVLDDEIVWMDPSKHHLYEVSPSQGFSAEEVVLSLDFLTGGREEAGGISWRILFPDGASSWFGRDDSFALDWGPKFLVEVKHSVWNGVDPGVPVLQVIPLDGEKEQWSAAPASACSGCLIPVSDAEFLLEDGPVWLGPEGVTSEFSAGSLDDGHAFADQGSGGAFVVGGSMVDYVWSHNATLGLPWKMLGIDPALDSSAYHRILDPHGNDLVLVEKGVDSTPVKLDLQPVQMQYYQVKPSSGSMCGFTKEDSWGLGNRVILHELEAPALVMGSDLGHLAKHAASSGDCAEEWSAEPLEVGSVLQIVIPTKRNAWPGPVVITAQVEVDVKNLDEVQLNLLGHSYRSRHGMSMSAVHFNTHLQYWLPGVNWEADVLTKSL